MEANEKQQILDGAREICAAEGFDHFTLRGLAQDLDFPATRPYRYFRSKADLLGQMVAQSGRLLSAHMETALAEKEAWHRLQLCGERLFEFALTHSNHYEVLFLAQQPSELVAREQDNRWDAVPGLSFFADRVRECMDEGLISPQDPTRVALSLWSQAHGLVTLYLRGKIAPSQETLTHLYTAGARQLFAGLRS